LRIESDRISIARKALDALADRQRRAFAARLSMQGARLLSLGQLLQSLGYRQVLARGFALIRDSEERPLRLASQIQDGDRLSIEFADGRKAAVAGSTSIGSTSTGSTSNGAAAKRAADKSLKKSEQGSLF
jgi:exodeoxyribonuclease VII large subunit